MAKPNVINKQTLIQSAKQCIVENGIESFTLRSVAEKAEVTQGTIYYHFRTKEQLLVEIVQDICESAWRELSNSDEMIIKEALHSAKSRCSHESFFHKLFFSLVAAGFHNEKIREQLGGILALENESLYKKIRISWTQSPINGVDHETWAILFNAMIDGIALQTVLMKGFPVDKVYEQIEKLIAGLNTLQSEDR
ncbi:TetR family transcriptional regulator [Ureibacillus xyleni]|uniref:TetR family transcriptional regulator n=1 Tax=Ureibacillus xyleni TaxID=614648 RepID=A0A285T9K5_9BACL|nr:TetR/AcrR family transcriptional regulator [Ureibacillus xyleni]SOC18187.1 TetR family transcriptional regulator [Ureibacillus xyleni]